jgi:hypothetical protein
MEEVLKGGSHLEASKRLLELGYTDDSVKFYLLSQQEIFLEGLNRQIASAEDVVNSNKAAGQFMIQAAEDNKSAAMQMCNAAEEMQQASRRMHQY